MKRLLSIVPLVAALVAAASLTLLPLAAQSRATATNVPVPRLPTALRKRPFLSNFTTRASK